jgi:hypothetical protein
MVSIPKVVGVLSCSFLLYLGLSISRRQSMRLGPLTL